MYEFLSFSCSHLFGPGGNGFITATAAACWLASTAAESIITKLRVAVKHSSVENLTSIGCCIHRVAKSNMCMMVCVNMSLGRRTSTIIRAAPYC